ncbi:MAG: glycosyltransferase family 2 protein [Candidatus Portnoybacteria bacterium]|nr:glycosyltransferase family 2 protein [Candidatus Portnoybacteria bacterium]
MPKVYIIIINYNSWRDTIESLESLKKITYQNFDILIVDNNSTDDSQEKIKKYTKETLALPRRRASSLRGRHVTRYTLHENLGFAGGNNVGIKHALKKNADYVLLLNPDTIVESNFLDKLVETAEQWKKQDKLAFFGPRILLYGKNNLNSLHDREQSYDNAKIYSNGGVINWSQTKGTLKDYGKFASEVIEIEPFETDYVSGTCMLISKELIEKLGLMREDYFLYYEDTDWCMRARKKGIKSVIVPQSIIWHKMSTSTKEGSPAYIYYHVRSGLYCGWWNGNILKKTFVFVISLWTFTKQPIKFFIPSKKKWAKPVMKGVIDFWRGKTGKIE